MKVFLFGLAFSVGGWEANIFHEEYFFFDGNHKNTLKEKHSLYNYNCTILCCLNQVFTNHFHSRHHVQDPVKCLMTEHEDFESVFPNELDMNTWMRIGKITVSMHSEVKRRALLSLRE
jgi:hypothetical protein